MKKAERSIRKTLLAAITLMLLFSVFSMPVKADEEGYEEGSIPVTTVYDNFIIGSKGTWTFEYNDRWFAESAETYNHKLAQLTLGMAVSSFRSKYDPDVSDDMAAHLTDFLSQCGFTDLRMDDYDKNPSLYTVSTVMGHKTLQDEDGEYVMIGLGICGGGYKNEWLSNFTIGTGVIHEGFLSAAEEIYDRVFGYIARQGLTGQRCKIWFGGFSRAAAISNVLGKLLSDSDVFSTDTVFVYTYATPRTTREPESGKYLNIFNICGKMDPVTQIPFADWGFERYGTTLYTPAQQTDSDYNISSNRAMRVFQDRVGTDFWNNVEWDTKLRVILNYLVRLAPSQTMYYSHLQDRMIRIWGDKTVPNIMRVLMEMASDELLINDGNRQEANSLLTYISYVAYGYATSSDIESRYRNEDATTISNLAHEHIPDIYLGWMYSTDNPKDLFTPKLDYLRVVVTGDVDVAIIMEDRQPVLVSCMKADGSYASEFDYDGQKLIMGPYVPDIFIERINNEHIMLLPKDATYKVIIHANRDQKVEVHGIPLKVGYTNGSFSAMHYADMKAGQNDVIVSNEAGNMTADGNLDIVTGDTFDVVKISQGTSMEMAVNLERANVFNMSWKQLIMILYSLPIAVICILGFFISWGIGAHRLKRRKKAGITPPEEKFDVLPTLGTYIALGLFLFQELLYWLMPGFRWQRSMLKFVIGLLALLVAYRGYRRQPSRLSKGVCTAIAVFIVADVCINYSFTAGILFYGVGEAMLLWHFYRHEETEKWQYTLWICLSVFTSSIVMIFGKSLSGLENPMIAYGIVISGMLTMAFTMPKRIRRGAILMYLSNAILFFNEVGVETLYSHVIALGIYYMAIRALSLSTRYNAVPRKPEEPVAQN